MCGAPAATSVTVTDPGEGTCFVAQRVEFVVIGLGPHVIELNSALTGLTLDPAGAAFTWTPSPQFGSGEVEVRVDGVASSRVSLSSSCPRASYVVGCGCDSGAPVLAMLAVALLRRRRLSGPR